MAILFSSKLEYFAKCRVAILGVGLRTSSCSKCLDALGTLGQGAHVEKSKQQQVDRASPSAMNTLVTMNIMSMRITMSTLITFFVIVVIELLRLSLFLQG